MHVLYIYIHKTKQETTLARVFQIISIFGPRQQQNYHKLKTGICKQVVTGLM